MSRPSLADVKAMLVDALSKSCFHGDIYVVDNEIGCTNDFSAFDADKLAETVLEWAEAREAQRNAVAWVWDCPEITADWLANNGITYHQDCDPGDCHYHADYAPFLKPGAYDAYGELHMVVLPPHDARLVALKLMGCKVEGGDQ
ncbi:hypothetical protein ACFODL_15470 [Phenylobacterium terrae]|uniref:Uncharacterized protein n=1 Tax=Phenylobacterium terrae TaxID=2665495 RepID=A0ABW4NAM2_9CAUL